MSINKPLTDAEILEMDFYDFCGSFAVFMSAEDRINWWRNFTKDCYD